MLAVTAGADYISVRIDTTRRGAQAMTLHIPDRRRRSRAGSGDSRGARAQG